MTAVYAFTDHRSQGQTILAVLVDIATPPTSGLEQGGSFERPKNVY